MGSLTSFRKVVHRQDFVLNTYDFSTSSKVNS
jgi:hypothetical protein